MKQLPLILGFLIIEGKLLGQDIVLIRDSIMNRYMESGFSNKKFRPKGKLNDNKREGKWLDYEVKEDGFYQVVDGKPMKTVSMYLLYGEGEFANGLRTGDWKIYVIEDKTFKKILSKTSSYLEGTENGIFQYYYPDGGLAQTGNYINGVIEDSSTIYYNTKEIFGLQFYKANKKTGEQKYFYQSGKLMHIFNYTDGIREGNYASYYENGNLKESFMYKADSIDGVYHYYYSTGDLWTEKIYKTGLLLNVNKLYDKKGKELDKGTLIDGNGFVNYYTEEGKIYSRITYQNGREVKEEKPR